MALLDDAKERLRLTVDAFNAEITDLIDAAIRDLKLGGVSESVMDAYEAAPDSDKLLKYAIMTYVKNHFGWNNPDYGQLDMAYKTLKGEITLSDEYINEVS